MHLIEGYDTTHDRACHGVSLPNTKTLAVANSWRFITAIAILQTTYEMCGEGSSEKHLCQNSFEEVYNVLHVNNASSSLTPPYKVFSQIFLPHMSISKHLFMYMISFKEDQFQGHISQFPKVPPM